ncbi:MAG: SDR family NAD(P)-dependent oxidoreductase [Candidatus Synoicihabitans palmerolidicus]|nr:SDR family NAD(P)-dependent oxidoreductase [Candidatus Synoicihabitans palmerolidicus]
MAVNYFGTLYALKTVLPAVRTRGSGRVILLSSGTGLFGFFGYSAYGATKLALRGLAESLHAECRDSGVNIHIVYPPDTDTPQLAHENQTKPPETAAITADGGLWTAEAVAKLILRQATAGRFSITPGLPLTLLAGLHSIIAPLLRWTFHRTARKARPSSRPR